MPVNKAWSKCSAASTVKPLITEHHGETFIKTNVYRRLRLLLMCEIA